MSAYLDAAIRRLNESIDRHKASVAAQEAGATTYWYFISSAYCPVCGHDDTHRSRQYAPRPEAWEERHEFYESYDYCDVL